MGFSPLCVPLQTPPLPVGLGVFSTVTPSIMLCAETRLVRWEAWVLSVLVTKGQSCPAEEEAGMGDPDTGTETEWIWG